MEELETRVQLHCLPFLRVASLLRYYIYSEPLPDIWEHDWEFTRLAQYVGLSPEDMEGRLISSRCLTWLSPPASLTATWCHELAAFSSRAHLAARKLVLVNNIWKQPQLLRLPKNYDTIFQVQNIKV